MRKKVTCLIVLLLSVLLCSGCLTNVMPNLTIPVAPTNLGVIVLSSTSVQLTWMDNSNNEVGFKIERSTAEAGNFQEVAAVNAAVTTYADNGLTANTTYYYRVKAFNTVGASNVSNVAQATTLNTAPEIPVAPGNLTAEALSSTEIKLTWADNAANETGFRIFRSTTATGGFIQIKEVGSNITSYNDTGLSAGTTYYYQIKAYNQDGESDFSNTGQAKTMSNEPSLPASPGNLTAQALSVSEIKLTWTDNAVNETGFRIFRSTSATGGFTQIKEVGSNITSYNDIGLSAGTTYYYQVKAYNAAGEAVSNTANATTQNNSVTTLRIYNNTSYAVISAQITSGDNTDELINSYLSVIPADGYGDYQFTLDGNSATLSYYITVGFWDTNGKIGRFVFWGDFTLDNGQTTDISLDISLAQVLSNFKTYSDWLGYYWSNGLMYYKFFRFYDTGAWELYDNGTLVDSGYSTLARWDNYSDSLYFQLEANGEAIMLYYPSTKFYYRNGPADWVQIEYVLQVN